VEVLREFGFEGDDVSPSLFAEPGAIIRMGIPPVRIELQTRISGVAFEECYQHRIVADFDGQPVNMISLDHLSPLLRNFCAFCAHLFESQDALVAARKKAVRLRQNKRAAGRNKDLADLENLP